MTNPERENETMGFACVPPAVNVSAKTDIWSGLRGSCAWLDSEGG